MVDRRPVVGELAERRRTDRTYQNRRQCGAWALRSREYAVLPDSRWSRCRELRRPLPQSEGSTSAQRCPQLSRPADWCRTCCASASWECLRAPEWFGSLTGVSYDFKLGSFPATFTLRDTKGPQARFLVAESDNKVNRRRVVGKPHVRF